MTPKLESKPSRIHTHFQVLCDQIGKRYSGTHGEQRAADYVEAHFKRLGLANVHQQPFEFPNWDSSRSALRVGRGGRLKRIAAASASGFSHSTPARGVRGRLVYLQSGSELNFKQDLRGKVGLLIGALSLGDEAVKDRLVQAGLAALIISDLRVPYPWPVATGGAPHWVNGYTLPTIGVPYFDAYELVKAAEAAALTAHVTIQARTFPDQSQNVLGEVVGTKWSDQVIVVSGHHDCVMGNVGANDNGSGVVFTMELASLFAKRRPRRTIRFASYGVEEKLSIGSYLYMRSLKPKQRQALVLAVNADGCGGRLGEDNVIVTGDHRLERLARDVWRRRRHPASVARGVMSYSDHYPMNIIGAPSLMLGRPSSLGGMLWELHSVHDNLENISIPVMRRTIDTTARFIHQVANAPRLPFARRIPADLMRQVRADAKAIYRHPWSPDDFQYPDS